MLFQNVELETCVAYTALCVSLCYEIMLSFVDLLSLVLSKKESLPSLMDKLAMVGCSAASDGMV